MIAAPSILATVLGLSACREEQPACTQDEAQKKVAEMMTKVLELAITHLEKLAAVGLKVQELQARLAGAENGPAK